MLKKIFYCCFLLLINSSAQADEKNISFSCKGISSFELMGASGVKEETKNISYKFIEGALQDLNNIECIFEASKITCDSTFLNFRKLEIDQKTKKVTDFISGNKGFGQYTENFEGICEKI